MTSRQARWSLAAGLLAAYAYFYQAGGWNQNSRFALVRAITEQGTFRIDDTVRFEGRLVTGDLAEHDGHFYSDKAPGLALAAVVPVAIGRRFVAEPTSRNGIATLSYIATVVTAGIPTMLTALLVFQLACGLGAKPGGAAFAALVFGLGTPAWCYATVLYGHALATACLLGAFAAAVALGKPPSARRDWLLGLLVGAAGGWATITEYPTAIPAALIALLALSYAISSDGARRARVVMGITGGTLACAAILGWFNQASFGSPLNLGYSDVREFEGMRQGFFGITYPQPGVLKELLIGRFRGLLPLSPVLALSPIGFYLLIRAPQTRRVGFAATAITIYYLLFNAAYYYWDGGWSYGPRHLAPALPFMCLALVPLWSVGKPALRFGVMVLALYGVALTFMSVSVTAQPSAVYKNPVTELIRPNFVLGHLSLNQQAFVEDNLSEPRDPIAHAWNLGERFGLRGQMSLAPLVAVWLFVYASLRRFSSVPGRGLSQNSRHVLLTCVARHVRGAWDSGIGQGGCVMRRLVGVLASLAILALPAMAIAGQAGKTMNTTGTVSAVTTDSITVKDSTGETKLMIDKDTSVTAKGATHKSLALKADGKSTVLTDFVKAGDTVRITYHDMGSMKHAATINVTISAVK